MNSALWANISAPLSSSRPNAHDICFFVIHLSCGSITVISSVVLLVGMKRQKLLSNGCMMTLAHFAVCDIVNGLLNVFYVSWVLLLQTDFVPRSVGGTINIFAEWSRKTFLVFMALTRFWAVVFPFSAKVYLGNKVFHLWIQGLWVVCALVCMPFWINRAIVFSYVHGGWKYRQSVPSWVMKYGLVTNILPTLTMLIAYPVCFYKIMQLKGRFKPGSSVTEQNAAKTPLDHKQSHSIVKLAKRERNMLLLFSLCSLIFTLYWSPFYLAKVFKLSFPMWISMFELMRDIQSGYNPFMYYWLHPQLRDAIRAGMGLKAAGADNSSINGSVATIHEMEMATAIGITTAPNRNRRFNFLTGVRRAREEQL